MITFEQFLNHTTCNQRYSWFYLETSLLDSLSEEEKLQLHIETISDETYCRVWWPKEKYTDNLINSEPSIGLSEIDKLKNKIRRAAFAGNIVKLMILKMQLEELQNNESSS